MPTNNKTTFIFFKYKFLFDSWVLITKVTFRASFSSLFVCFLMLCWWEENQILPSITWPKNLFHPCCRFMTITDVILHFMSNNANALFYYFLSDFIYSDTSAYTLTPILSPGMDCSKQCYNIPIVSFVYIISGQWLKSKATYGKKSE